MERLLAAQNGQQGGDNFMLNFARMQKKVRLSLPDDSSGSRC